jgi:hypothetical protein
LPKIWRTQPQVCSSWNFVNISINVLIIMKKRICLNRISLWEGWRRMGVMFDFEVPWLVKVTPRQDVISQVTRDLLWRYLVRSTAPVPYPICTAVNIHEVPILQQAERFWWVFGTEICNLLCLQHYINPYPANVENRVSS